MTKLIDSTPRADGYRMPGEFEPHSGCWMAWPERPDNWRSGAKAFAAVAEAINASDPVTVAVSDAQFEHARSVLSPSIRVVEMATDDAWMRDTGPTFVTDQSGGVRGVDWHFNAWGGLDGGLYFPWDRDDRVARKVLEIEGADRAVRRKRVRRSHPRADRADAPRLPGCGEGHLARPWRLRRRDRRSRRQPRLLRPPRRRAAHLERRRV